MDPLAQHALRLGAERRIDSLRRRFRALSTAYDWRFDSWRAPWRRWQRLRYWLAPALFGVLLGHGALAFHDLSATFGSATIAARHVASAPNCDAARAQGLAPAYRGQPGYYSWHDADADGIACEPWLGR